MTINRVHLYGHLTRNPEVRHTPNGTPVIEFSIGVNKRYKTADGEMREETSYIDIFAIGKVVDVLDKYLSTGKPVYVEGELKQDRWEKDGQTRSRLRVRLIDFQFGPSKEGAGSERSRRYQDDPVPAGRGAAVDADAGLNEDDDNVPF